MVPILVGGFKVHVLPMVVYEQVLSVFDWPFGAANAFVLLVISVALIAVYIKGDRARACGDRVILRAVVGLVYAFLLLPMVIVVLAAFNAGNYFTFPRRASRSSGSPISSSGGSSCRPSGSPPSWPSGPRSPPP